MGNLLPCGSFLMTKGGSEEGAQPEWPSLRLDYRQNIGFDRGMFDPGWLLDMPGALRNARDDAGDWQEYMVPPYEYEEYAENNSDTGGGKPQYVERAAGGTHDAGLQPSDTTEPAGLGGMQGGIVVSLRVGHPVNVHGVVSMRDGSVS